MINGGTTPYVAHATLAELNITGATKVTDVWTGAAAGAIAAGNWTSPEIPSLDSSFVVFQK